MLTKRQLERRDLYLRHQQPDDGFDWSDEAFLEADDYESRGVLPRTRDWSEPSNGFLASKRAMDITIAAWKEDIEAKLLWPEELLADGYSEKYLKSIGILRDSPPAPAPFEIGIEVVTEPPPTPSYDHLTTEQLNDLIHELSQKSRMEYEAKMALRPPESLSEAILAPRE